MATTATATGMAGTMAATATPTEGAVWQQQWRDGNVMATTGMKGAAATQRRQWKARRRQQKAQWQQQRRDVDATSTAAMATVMAAKTITTTTTAVVEVMTKMAEGTDTNQLKW